VRYASTSMRYGCVAVVMVEKRSSINQGMITNYSSGNHAAWKIEKLGIQGQDGQPIEPCSAPGEIRYVNLSGLHSSCILPNSIAGCVHYDYKPNCSCNDFAISIKVSSILLYFKPRTFVNFDPSAMGTFPLIFSRADSSPLGTFLMSGFHLWSA
jgi:hypothetical protein